MKYFLSPDVCLKRLENPSVYSIKTDELYELDEQAFNLLKNCSSINGCIVSDNDFLEYCLSENILQKEPAHISRPTTKQSPVPSLRYLELQITNRCNLRCRHCYIGDSSIHELNTEQIRNILEEFQNMQGLRVMITGGEPLLHRNFQEINRMLPDFLFRKVLFTNGLLLTKKLLNTLNVDEIQISIDGLEDAHDALRGKGTFKKVMDALNLCIENNVPVSVATMLHRMNLGDMEKMQKIFRDLGVLDWTVDIPCASGRLGKDSSFYLSPSDGGKFLRYGFGKGLHGSGEGFGCGLHLMAVMSDGKAAKCTFYADSPAGMISEGLKTCWKKVKPIRLSELQCDCEHIESCRGGCRYRAETLGNRSGRDLYRCFLYDIIR